MRSAYFRKWSTHGWQKVYRQHQVYTKRHNFSISVRLHETVMHAVIVTMHAELATLRWRSLSRRTCIDSRGSNRAVGLCGGILLHRCISQCSINAYR